MPVIAILGYLEAQKSQIFRGSAPYPAGGGGLQRPQLFLLASLVSLALKTADSLEISYFDRCKIPVKIIPEYKISVKIVPEYKISVKIVPEYKISVKILCNKINRKCYKYEFV